MNNVKNNVIVFKNIKEFNYEKFKAFLVTLSKEELLYFISNKDILTAFVLGLLDSYC